MAIPFVEPIDPRYGETVAVSPMIRRVVARNPSKYTYLGTGTYIVGHGDVAVIDPGPELDAHRDALWAALSGERVRAILVTHCHSDHSPLAAWLREETGAPTFAFGPHLIDPLAVDDPDPEADPTSAPASGTDGEPADEEELKESIDTAFAPDVVVADGDPVDGPGWSFTAVHTPGHTSNHTCYGLAEERALFSGDHIMGWSTTVVSPPDGDMRAYCDSVRKLQARSDATLWPTHGGAVTSPAPFLQAYLDHRLEREAAVLDMVRSGVGSITDIVEVLYTSVRRELHRAAGRSVQSHLRKLVDDGLVLVEGGGPALRLSTYVPA